MQVDHHDAWGRCFDACARPSPSTTISSLRPSGQPSTGGPPSARCSRIPAAELRSRPTGRGSSDPSDHLRQGWPGARREHQRQRGVARPHGRGRCRRLVEVILPDVNVFVAAHREDHADHDRHLSWMEQELASDRRSGVSELALSGFVRIRHEPSDLSGPVLDRSRPGLLRRPAGIAERRRRATRSPPLADLRRAVSDGRRPSESRTRRYFAALTIEHGAGWVTNDRDFARFPGLRWRTPFED